MNEVRVEKLVKNSNYAKYKVSHLEIGYGFSVANSLKRVLISNCSSVCRVEFDVIACKDYDELILEIWTAESGDPDLEFKKATQKLREYFEIFEKGH